MGRFWSFIVRVSSFLRKEIVEIIRQPRLVLTLVLGPFLILLLFGIGYRYQAQPLRTLFVVPADSELSGQIQQYATTLGPQLIFSGITQDQQAALQQLKQNQVDVVIVVPDHPYETIQSSGQAIFTLYHNQIDPFQAAYVQSFGQIYVDEVNRRVLTQVVQQGQQQSAPLQGNLSAAQQSATALREALQAGDEAAAAQHQAELNSNLGSLTVNGGAGLLLLSGIQGAAGQSSQGSPSALLSDIQQSLVVLNTPGASTQDRIARAQQIEQDLSALQDPLSRFQQMNPVVLVSPFASQIQSVTPIKTTLTDFYTPGVIALLLQHICVTFAALSLVRERQLGTTELFQVSPLSTIEILLGKYLSYLIFASVLATILSLLLYFGLGIPMLGRWADYALTLLALIFTSLSIGFLLSLLSRTTSQAVQYSMIILLTSVFFSGFLQSLQTLWKPVRAVSYALPVTYAILLLQDIMLRGNRINWQLLGTLAGIGVLLFLLSIVLLRRLMRAR